MRRPAAPAPADAPLLGAHMSIAGGLHHAILAAARHRCRTVQIFSRSSNQWRARTLSDEDVALWHDALARHPMIPVVHDSYLINLASPDATLLRRSRAAFLEEVRRCDRLGVPYLVFHPGAHMGSGETAGLRRIAESLDWVCERVGGSRVRLLLETTAGQGTTLGHRLEHLEQIFARCRTRERLGVCVDTCHLLAAGYDFRTPEGYAAVFEEVDRRIGLQRIRCFHVNDSKKDLGCRVDRHEHIGRGFVGSAAFGLLMRDGRFAAVPKILETPKMGEMDRKNLARLRRLARGRRDVMPPAAGSTGGSHRGVPGKPLDLRRGRPTPRPARSQAPGDSFPAGGSASHTPRPPSADGGRRVGSPGTGALPRSSVRTAPRMRSGLDSALAASRSSLQRTAGLAGTQS